MCALQPYQDRLHADNDVTKGFNARLNAEAFGAHEGHFTFVIIRNGDMELDQIKRSAQLDIFGSHKLPAEVMLPGQFVQASVPMGNPPPSSKSYFVEGLTSYSAVCASKSTYRHF